MVVTMSKGRRDFTASVIRRKDLRPDKPMSAKELLASAQKDLDEPAQKTHRKSTSMPKAGPVKVTRRDGTIEILPPYRGGSTNNIGIYKTT